jgi:hypothetical protein
LISARDDVRCRSEMKAVNDTADARLRDVSLGSR